MGKKNDWLPKMPHERVGAFLARAGEQLTRPQFNAVLRGEKKLGLVDLSQKVSGTTTPKAAKDDLPIAISYDRMLEIIGQRAGEVILTQQTLNDLFGIKAGRIPPIVIREWELKRYIDLAFPHAFLYLPVEMSMKDIYEKLTPKYRERGWGKVLFNTNWYGGGKENFFTKPIQPGWMAHSLTPVPETGDENFLRHTEIHKDFICKQIYQKRALPIEIREAVAELDKKKCEEIRLLIAGDKWQEGARMLANLKFNQMFCPPSPAEKLLFSAVIRAQTGKNIFENVWGWTHSLSSDGGLVAFGPSDLVGAYVNGRHPRYSNSHLQRFSSRRF